VLPKFGRLVLILASRVITAQNDWQNGQFYVAETIKTLTN